MPQHGAVVDRVPLGARCQARNFQKKRDNPSLPNPSFNFELEGGCILKVA
jgi:hypothetical protein